MPQALKVLIAEDNPDDALLLLRELRRNDFEPEWKQVDTESDFLASLHAGWDLILSDYQMPQFTGLRALELLKKSGLVIPFILVSGTIGEDMAVQAMKNGTTDYLLKDRLARLGPAVGQALEQGRLRKEQAKADSAIHLFRTLVDQSADTFEIIDPETGRFLDVSEKSCAVLGYTREEHLLLGVADIDPTVRARGWPEVATAIRFAGSLTGESQHRCKDGTVFPIEFSARWVRLDRDYIVTVVRDITERKRAEGILQQASSQVGQRRRKTAALELVVIGLSSVLLFGLSATYGWFKDVDFWMERLHLAYWDELMVTAFYLALGLAVFGFRRWRESESELTSHQQLQTALRLLRDELETRVQQRTAEQAETNSTLRIEIAKRQQAAEALGESEERFRQMAENIDEVFWMTDPAKARMLYISPGYEKIWGRSSSELYASPLIWIEAILPEDRQRVVAATTTKQATGDYDEEYRIVQPDGAVRWIRDRAFPIKDASGQVYRVVGVAQDITERKKLEEQFLQAQRVEAVGTLANGMAHDLNNILAPSLMVAGLLKTRFTAEKDHQLLDMIESSAKRGANLIRQLLMFSRGATGQRVPVQLRHLIGEMAEIMRETFPRDIAIEDEAPADLWPVVGDATQLHQVLMNLCVNARDAMPRGGRLTVGAQNYQMEVAGIYLHPDARVGRYALLTVSDTGQGIPPEVMKRIFDPFFTTKEIGKGTGLGLSTVIGIAKSHGGFVTVYSEVGRGTAFKVYLPVEDAPNKPASVTQGEATRRGEAELVLVVDDEAHIATAARLTLEQQNYRVLVAGQGQEAVALFLAHQDTVRLVLTDLMMPVMGGLALVRALRTIRPDLPVIATTGLDQEERQAELAGLGVTEILMKPYSSNDLLAAIRRQLDKV